METTKEQLANGIGAAFATTFWQVIKHELPKKFTWKSFINEHKEEVKEKLHLFFTKVPEGEDLEQLKNIAEQSFIEACHKIQQQS